MWFIHCVFLILILLFLSNQRKYISSCVDPFAVYLRSTRRTPVYQKCLCRSVASPAKPWILRRSRTNTQNQTNTSLCRPACDTRLFLSLSLRSSCQFNSTRSTTSFSPCTTSAVTATARRAPRRETWWRLKVLRWVLVLLFNAFKASADCCYPILSQWASPGCLCWRTAGWSWAKTKSQWLPTCLLDTSVAKRALERFSSPPCGCLICFNQ